MAVSEGHAQRLVAIRDWFLQKEMSLGFAESCTGGLLSSLLTELPGVSPFYMGAVISYHGKVKENLLSVPAATLRAKGEVSIEAALAMAHGAKSALGADWAVSITGVAGPSGGTLAKPVGLVCFAVAGPSFEQSIEKRFKPKDRRKIQLESAEFAIDFLWDSIHA